MTISELLVPRYQALRDYPYSPYKVDQIITGTDSHIVEEGFVSNEIAILHRNIFYPLSWYEDRSQEDMPMYLKSAKEKKRVSFKVIEWVLKRKALTVEGFEGKSVYLYIEWFLHDLLPCSKEEYEAIENAFNKRRNVKNVGGKITYITLKPASPK